MMQVRQNKKKQVFIRDVSFCQSGVYEFD